MWPSKNGLGVALSYGVLGNGVVNLKENQDETKIDIGIEFPRKSEGRKLYGIEDSEKVLVRSQASEYSIKSRMYDNFKSSISTAEDPRSVPSDSQWFIPKDILKSYLVESQFLTSTIAFDPTYGQLMTFSELRSRNGNSSQKVMAFVSGTAGNILNISSMSYQHVEIENRDSSSEEYGSYTPEIGIPFKIALSGPIKHILFSNRVHDYIPSFLIVRTDSRIYVLNCFIGSARTIFEKSNVECDILGEIDTSDLEGSTFADVSFNPYDISQFGLIDVKGNFGLWEIKKDNLEKLVRLQFEEEKSSNTIDSRSKTTVADLTELSNWKRLLWSIDSNSIIVVTRSCVTKFTLTPSLVPLKLITSNTWSQIKDIFRHGSNAFLLTSKEIIWISLDSPTQRLVSWKHFLSDEDPSLKLSVKVHSDGETYTCMIYSQVHPLIFVFQFGIIDNKPYSQRDPYYIKKQEHTENLLQIRLEELDRSFFTSSKETHDEEDLIVDSDDEKHKLTSFGLFELTTDLKLSVSLYSELKGLGVHQNVASSSRSRSRSPTDRSDTECYKPHTSKYYRKFSKQKLVSLMGELIASSHKLTLSQEIQQIQDYAFKLGEGSSKLKTKPEHLSAASSYLSLLQIASQTPDQIDDLSELESMIVQLTGFYNEKGIKIHSFLSSFINMSSILSQFGGAEMKDSGVLHLQNAISSVFSKIEELDMHRAIKRLTIQVGSSLMKAHRPSAIDDHKSSFAHEIENASELTKSILEEWDEDKHIGDTKKGPETKGRFQDISSSIPTVRLSSQEKPRRLATQGSLRHQALTQSRSQSQLKFKNDKHSQSTKLPIMDSQVTLASDDNLSSQEGPSSSQTMMRTLPSSLRSSQKRPTSLNSSQSKQKKKRRGGFS